MRAFLFDLDGTLIDSMPHHQGAWNAWYAQRGLPMESGDFFAATAGRSNAEILADLFPGHSAAERVAMADEKEALYRGIASKSLELIGGAHVFVEQARQAGLHLAVCTASTPDNMALAFELHGIDGWVETVVSPGHRHARRPLGGVPGDRSAACPATARSTRISGPDSALPASRGTSPHPPAR